MMNTRSLKNRRVFSPSYAIACRIRQAPMIVPPEKPTPGYMTVNLSASHRFTLRGDRQLSLAVQLGNLLNTTYYDHTSYYRLIDVPEPWRHVSLRIKYEF